MPIQILEQLFDSPVKVKLLKLFLRNPEKFFSLKEAAGWIRFNGRLTKKEIEKLESVGFLRIRKIRARSAKKKGKRKEKQILKPGLYYSVNPHFEFYNELSSLVLKSSPASREKLLKSIQKLGRIKLAVLAGVFLNTENSRADLLIVGDNISKKKFKTFLANLESEVGKEIIYALMNSKEFDYRYHMFDRFIRDVLEKPHEKLVNKIKVF